MNICIYGASSNIIDKKYIDLTEELGKALAIYGHALVYGGGGEGLMGAAARGFHQNGGKVIGVAPSFFKVDGVLFDECDEFVYTENMRQRKEIMEKKSDAFIVTPGGIGTLDEFFEIYTLRQLCRHNKPIFIYNIFGYFDELIKMLDKAVKENFMKPSSQKLYKVFDNPQEVCAYLENYTAEDSNISELKNITKEA